MTLGLRSMTYRSCISRSFFLFKIQKQVTILIEAWMYLCKLEEDLIFFIVGAEVLSH